MGNARLEINDLTPSGNQPFFNPAKTIQAVVNGEVYNHEELRAEILSRMKYDFKGRSDCESVVALYQYYGLGFLSKLNGEYAICIYDSERKLLIAARDRSGVKPLYWTIAEGKLLVASEMKAFLPLGWKPEWDVGSLVDGGWNTDARTIFRAVQKVCLEKDRRKGRLMSDKDTSRPIHHLCRPRSYRHQAVLGARLSRQGTFRERESERSILKGPELETMIFFVAYN